MLARRSRVAASALPKAMHGRNPSTSAMIVLFTVTTMLTVLSTFHLNFSMPPKSRGIQRTRADLPRQNMEIPLEEPEAEVPEPEPLPPRRIPYTISMFTHTPSGKTLNEASREHIENKVHMALENTADWVKSVEVRVTVDDNRKADRLLAPNPHKIKRPQRPQLQEEGPADMQYEMKTFDDSVSLDIQKRDVVPFHIEVSVHLTKGSVVMSKSAHAQATLTEAADHMYDFLRRQMRKVKDKRVKEIRHAAAIAGAAVADYTLDMGVDQMQTIDEDEAMKLDAEAEKFYASVEPTVQEPQA